MPASPYSVQITHSGFYPDGRPNVSSIFIDDISDTGQINQNRKVPVYVPVGGSITLPMTDSVLMSYERGAIDQMITVGLITAFLNSASGVLASNGIQSATFANENFERVFYTLTIPGGTVKIGDNINLQYYIEMLAPGDNGGVRTRIRQDDLLGSIVVDSNFQNPLGLPAFIGFEFLHTLIIDQGSGLSAARMINNNDSVDFVFNFTVDVVLVFTAQWNVANENNEYRGLAAHISR